MYCTFLESLGIELQNMVDLKNVDPHKDELEDLKVSRMPVSQYNHFSELPNYIIDIKHIQVTYFHKPKYCKSILILNLTLWIYTICVRKAKKLREGI